MNSSQQTKIRSIAVLIVAAFLLELTTAVQFFSTRSAISAQIKEMAQRDLSATNRTAEVKQIAEDAISEVLPEVEHLLSIGNEDSLHKILQKIVILHPEIAGIDFVHRVGEDGIRNGYFTFRDVTKNSIADTIIDFDYTERTWYREGLHGNGFWCEPYKSHYYVTLMSTFSRPVKDNHGNVVAVIGADVPMQELSALAAQLYNNQQRTLIPVILLQFLGLIVLGFIIYRSIRSVRRLNEISAEKEFINRELLIANRIQTAMLPPEPIENEMVSVAGSQVPAKQVGGDFYDYFIRDGKLFFNIGDVCGKGIPAALVMSMTQAVFRTVASKEDDPSRIVQDMNKIASRGNNTNMFATLFVGVLDLSSGLMRYSNAGHEHPLIMNGKNIHHLDAKSHLPIGIMEETHYQNQETTVTHGDMIMLYTDGLTEAMNAEKELFGIQRIIDTLSKKEDSNSSRDCEETATPQQLLKLMTQSVNTFVNGAEQSDDLTTLAILFK